MKPPVPQTKVAFLPSLGFNESRTTRHIYVATRECVIGGPNGDAWEFIFRCDLTGVERRWGVIGRSEITN